MQDIGIVYESIEAFFNDCIYIMDNMKQSWNAMNVELMDIELIK